jgi:glutamine amidotransferase
VIAVLDYGIGNLRSAEKALLRVGADARLVTDPDAAAGADGVVLPGVGAFGRCMQALRECRLDAVVDSALARGIPFLGICVGMQMLYEASEESPGVAGLGLLAGVVKRLPEGVKRPQMQWNRLELADRGAELFSAAPALAVDPWCYFVHSYVAPASPDLVATCDYGHTVAAALIKGRLWATQFHPEKSGPTGLAILASFAAMVAASSGAA